MSVNEVNYDLHHQPSLSSKDQFLRVNISGKRFQIKKDYIFRHVHTRLGEILLCRKYDREGLYDFYDKKLHEYYFQRDPACFLYVISYYANDLLHLPRNICAKFFKSELSYWGIPFRIDDCCHGNHQQEWHTTENFVKMKKLFLGHSSKTEENNSMASAINPKPEAKWTKLKRMTWDLFDTDKTSRAASAVAVVSSAMVTVSTITLCVSTLPELKVVSPIGIIQENPYLTSIETICICWFTFEYLARVISCPNKRVFLKSVLNAIDLLAIVPFYMGVALELFVSNFHNPVAHSRQFIQFVRVFRIIRIFKFVRHSTGLQILGYTVKQSGPELGLLFMLLIMGMILFSCLVFYAEQSDKDTKFKSIVAAFWWAIVTMTTVGYGDMYPKTTIGQLIGSICCVSGILFIALPIPSIVSNFSTYYKDHLNKEKFSKIYEITNGEPESISTSSVSLNSFTATTNKVNVLSKCESLSRIKRTEKYRSRSTETVDAYNQLNQGVYSSAMCSLIPTDPILNAKR